MKTPRLREIKLGASAFLFFSLFACTVSCSSFPPTVSALRGMQLPLVSSEGLCTVPHCDYVIGADGGQYKVLSRVGWRTVTLVGLMRELRDADRLWMVTASPRTTMRDIFPLIDALVANGHEHFVFLAMSYVDGVAMPVELVAWKYSIDESQSMIRERPRTLILCCGGKASSSEAIRSALDATGGVKDRADRGVVLFVGDDCHYSEFCNALSLLIESQEVVGILWPMYGVESVDQAPSHD